MWVIAAMMVASCAEICLVVRDFMVEIVRRFREPTVEAEVKRRTDSADVPIARPATPDVKELGLHEWLVSDPKTYPINSFRQAAAIFGAFLIVAVLCATVLSDMYGEWIGMGCTVFMVAGVISVGMHKPSLAWRVRREVRIASVASSHGAEYVSMDVPGQGWDLTGVRRRVDQVARDWAGGGPLGRVSSRAKNGDSGEVESQGSISVLDEKPVEVIRSASRPYLEYGMEKLETNVFRFYVVAEILSLPYVAIHRRPNVRTRQQRRAVYGGFIDQAYVVDAGCQETLSRLSRRTRELMVGVHVDKMVLDGGWAVLWWDGRISGGIDFGRGQNWDGRMDMASEKTWDGVQKVRALLTSIENDLAIGGLG